MRNKLAVLEGVAQLPAEQRLQALEVLVSSDGASCHLYPVHWKCSRSLLWDERARQWSNKAGQLILTLLYL